MKSHLLFILSTWFLCGPLPGAAHTFTTPASVTNDGDNNPSSPWFSTGSTTLRLDFDTSDSLPADAVINQVTLRIQGEALSPSYRSEIDLAVTSPDGPTQSWDFGTNLGLPNSAGTYDTGILTLTNANGTTPGIFTLEITEDYNDANNDHRLDSISLVVTYTANQTALTTPMGAYLNGAFPSQDPSSGSSQPPALLSQTGAFTDLANLTPASGLISYSVNSPLWSDAALKQRWVAVPTDGQRDSAGEQIIFDPDQPWTFPAGTVAVKHFELGTNDNDSSQTRRLETRFLVATPDGGFYGLTYRWLPDGSDAELLPDAATDDITITNADGTTRTQTWSYPSRSDCHSCHNRGAGVFLGLTTWQLNGAHTYPGDSSPQNQIQAWSDSGLFSTSPGEPTSLPAAVNVKDQTATLEHRVRSYLAANCSNCHNVGSENDLNADFDLFYSTPTADTETINAIPLYDLGINDARIIKPRDPDASVLLLRMNTADTHRMPPIGRSLIDQTAVDTVRAWILSLDDGSSSNNNPPSSNPDEALTRQNTAVTIDLFANDTDADGDSFSIYTSTLPTHGTLTWGSAGSVTYSPDPDFSGTDSFIYQTIDTNGGISRQTTVTITVSPAATSNAVTFTDASSRLANSSSYNGVALGVVDMNQDGRDDIVHLNNAREILIDYQPAGSGSFTSLSLGSPSSNSQWGMAIGDADNNGYPDIITGGYFDGLHLFQANNSGTSYTSSTLNEPLVFLQATNFADIDNDGLLDIFACHDVGLNAPFRNTGNFTFEHDLTLINTSTTELSDNSGNYGSVWSDYDNDGDLDLYISKCRGGVSSPTDPRRINQLFRQEADGSFTEIAAWAGVADGSQSWTADFADIDNDGDLDLFIGNHMAPSLMMRNDGDGRFSDITSASGIDVDWKVIQSIFRDFNNDGWTDLLLTGESHELWLNNGDGTFTLTSNPFTSHNIESAAVGDLNNDGFPDVYAGYASLYNSPNSSRPDKLFLSTPNGNNFLSIRLKGRESNALASGSRLELHGPWGIQVREVRSGEGYGITNSFSQRFGMGAEAIADKLVIRWPSGTVDTIANVAANQFLIIQEGDSTPPTLTNPGNQLTASATPVTLALNASDPHGNVLTFSASNLPTGLSLNPSTGLISGTTANAGGTFPVSVSASNGLVSTTQSFTWTIEAPADEPNLAFGGVLPTIPSRIQAENFDTGGPGVSYYDNDSGNTGDYYRDSDVDLEPSLDEDDSASVGWAGTGEWLHYSINLVPGTYDLVARAASEFAAPGALRILLDDSLLGTIDISGTGGWYDWQDFTLYDVAVTGSGPATLRIEFLSPEFNLNWIEFRTASGNGGGDGGGGGNTQQSYTESVATLPGLIEAEHFDLGGEGISWSDADPENIGASYRDTSVDLERSQDFDDGYSIGWIENNEWVEYTVNVTPGNYDFTARIASAETIPGAMRVLLDDRELGILTVPGTGAWYDWQDSTLSNLSITESGTAILRLEFIGGPYNLNWIRFGEPSGGGDGGSTAQSPYLGSPSPIPGRIQAEHFDLGGPGVAYQDNDVLNLTGEYRNEGVDIENSFDVDDTYSLGWFDANEWLEYTTNVEPGIYTITIRTAAGESNPGDLRILLDSSELAVIDVPDTGAPHNWASTSVSGISIPEGGTKTLRVETVGSGINFNWIEFTRTATYSSSQTPPEPTTIHKDLLASALGSWNGIPAELQQPRMTFVEDDGKRYPAVTFLIRLGGWKTENGYVTNELCYEPVCSETVHTWDEPLVRVNNPPGLPVPPAGFKFATFRFDNNAPDKAFFRVNVYAKNVDPTASDF